MKNRKLSKISLAGLLVFSALAFTGCAVLEVLSQKLEDTVVRTRNASGEDESDYAVKYTVQVRNKGGEGRVRAIGELYTDGAQYYREQVVTMKPQEVRTFVFVFDEITFPEALLSEGKARAEFRYDRLD